MNKTSLIDYYYTGTKPRILCELKYIFTNYLEWMDDHYLFHLHP